MAETDQGYGAGMFHSCFLAASFLACIINLATFLACTIILAFSYIFILAFSCTTTQSFVTNQTGRRRSITGREFISALKFPL